MDASYELEMKPATASKKSASTDDKDHHDEVKSAPAPEFQLSRRRWLILGGICCFGFVNGLVNEMNSILSIYVGLLGFELNEYLYLSQIFLYLIPIYAVPTAWFLDRFGLKTFVSVLLVLAAIRNGARALIFYPEVAYWQQLRVVCWTITGIVSCQIVLGYYCLPLKVAENWFPKEERSLAWSLIYLSPQLGIFIISLVLPRLVTDTENVHVVSYINLTTISICAVMVLATITRSKPKHPPSSRRAKAQAADELGVLRNIQHLARNRNLIIQMCATNTFDVIINTILSILQDILGASGLSQVFTGQFMACTTCVAIISQLTGSFLLGRHASRSADDESGLGKCKLFLSLQCVAFLGYAGALSLRDSPEHQWWLALTAALLYTIIKSLGAPNFANMSAQLIAGSVTEASVSSFNGILYCVLASSYTVVFVYLRREDPLDGRSDYTASLTFASVMIVTATLIYLYCFRLQPTTGPKPVNSKQNGLSNVVTGEKEAPKTTPASGN